MIEYYPHLNDENLEVFLNRFPIDKAYGIPVLTDPMDILELHRRLVAPKYREPGVDLIELVYEYRQNLYTPQQAIEGFARAPYCEEAEGMVRMDAGWRALVYQGQLSDVARLETIPVKLAMFEKDLIIGAATIDADGDVAFKKDWKKDSSEPSGCYFDIDQNPYIVSPPVIAMYYNKPSGPDEPREPHFFYDKRRFKRGDTDRRANGFVWIIRSAELGIVPRIMIKRFIKNSKKT